MSTGLRSSAARLTMVGLAAVTAVAGVVAAAGFASADPSAALSVVDRDEDDRVQILRAVEADGEVVLDIAVSPSIGSLPTTADSFGVTDAGQLVDPVVTATGAAPEIVLVIDTSGSMRGSALDAAKAAADGFLAALSDEAKVGLISFGETVVTHRDLTTDRAAIRSDLDALRATGEETVLWDALVVAADSLGGDEEGRSSIVVLSDGDDTASSSGPADVAASFGSGSAALYAVAIESPDTDLVSLEQTVREVDGQFLATTDIGQLDTLYNDIAGRLANRYRLRFAPAVEGERTIVVSVAADDGVVTARTTIGQGAVGLPQPEAPTPSPPPVLNVGDQPTLGVVVVPSPGRFGGPVTFWVGLGSVFAAVAIGGVIVLRPTSQVHLNTAAGADRLVGLNVRLGRVAERMISRHDRGGRIDRRLEAADIDMRPGEFVLGWLVTTAVVAMVATLLIGPAAAPVVFLVSIGVVLSVLSRRANGRRSRFADQLTETLSIMASSLRAGQSLPRSIELVAAEAPSPTAEQFHRIGFEVRVGRDLTESIGDAADRMESPDLRWLAHAVDINRTLGGDLTEILDNIAATIRERRTVARQVDALSAEGRATAWVLLGMPVVLFLFSWWRTPESVERMVSDRLGQVLLGVAVTGMAVGYLWIRQLVKVRY